MSGQVIGSSGEQSTKVAAKEAAAYAALAYLATQNFDVAYVFRGWFFWTGYTGLIAFISVR
jgi:hypothetical protein